MTVLPDLAVALAAAGFALMGVGALAAPTLVTRQFGIADLDRDGRNEVRAVYGGFGLTIAAMLGLALAAPELRAGICLTVGAALAGMASGRLVSWALDGALGRTAGAYLALEAVAAAGLAYAA
jgi:hypothetical protein